MEEQERLKDAGEQPRMSVRGEVKIKLGCPDFWEPWGKKNSERRGMIICGFSYSSLSIRVHPMIPLSKPVYSFTYPSIQPSSHLSSTLHPSFHPLTHPPNFCSSVYLQSHSCLNIHLPIPPSPLLSSHSPVYSLPITV